MTKRLNVCFCIDEKNHKHVLTVINSICENTRQRFKNLFSFGILCDSEETSDSLKNCFEGSRLKNYKRRDEEVFIIKTIREDHKNFILKHIIDSNESLMSLSRFFIPEYFGEKFDEILYMNVDMVVDGGDLYNLTKTIDFEKSPLWAVPMLRDDFVVPAVIDHVPNDYKFFNAGIYSLSVKQWFKSRLNDKFLQLVNLYSRCEVPLFTLNSQNILNLLYLGKYGELKDKYNVLLNCRTKESGGGVVFHWNGKSKGWDEGNPYRDLWEKYSCFPSEEEETIPSENVNNSEHILTELCRLSEMHQTNKNLESRPNCTKVYYSLFEEKRYDENVVLNIGCQDLFSEKKNLYMWNDFFPNSLIRGIITNEKSEEEEHKKEEERRKLRIKYFTTETLENNLEELINKIQIDSKKDQKVNFDIIIDSGHSEPELQIKTMLYFLDKMNSEGIYVIENLSKDFRQNMRKYLTNDIILSVKSAGFIIEKIPLSHSSQQSEEDFLIVFTKNTTN